MNRGTMKKYGQELILDLHDCSKLTIDIDIQAFCEELFQKEFS